MTINQTHKIAYDYAQAMRTQRVYEQQVEVALGSLCRDNTIFSLCEPVEGPYTELLQQTIGTYLFDWLLWWMYDSDYGTKPYTFSVDGGKTTHTATDLTLYKFLEIVDEKDNSN